MPKLKSKDIATVRESLLNQQGNYCAICCNTPLRPVLDHNHAEPGNVRGVLCNGCNIMEGKIFNNHKRYGIKDLPSWLNQLSSYLLKHQHNPSDLIHPTYFTPNERKERAKRRLSKRNKLNSSKST